MRLYQIISNGETRSHAFEAEQRAKQLDKEYFYIGYT